MPTTELIIDILLTTSVFAFNPEPAKVYATARNIAGGALIIGLGLNLIFQST